MTEIDADSHRLKNASGLGIGMSGSHIGPDEYRARQRRLLDQLSDDALLIIPNHCAAVRTNDVEHPYRSHSDLLYLTGWTEQDSLLTAHHGLDGWVVTLFVPPRDTLKEIWTGIRPGIEGALESHPIDATESFDDATELLPMMIRRAGTIALAVGIDSRFDDMVHSAMKERNRDKQRFGSGPNRVIDPAGLISEMRLRKSEAEVDLMRRAAEIAAAAHIDAMRAASPGIGEWDLQAIIEAGFMHSRSRWSYPSIVAGGDRATILHYHNNDTAVEDGELVLIDAGCEVQGYASDITRTFPVNGHFSEPQREIYEIVLAAQKAAIDQCTVGNPFDAPHDAAKRVLAAGLVRLGVLEETEESEEALGRWYMHNTGHWLGLDVHDVGVYLPGGSDGDARPFESGMVITVEPGLYFGAWRTDVEVPQRYSGIGIRIEDDVLITEKGPILLTASCPKEIDEIEALVGTATEETR